MELRHLRYFVAVAAAKNFTRAAKSLRVSQPPLSRQIRDLEEELGARLFERDTRQVELTPAGKALYHEARRILDRVDDAVRRVQRMAGAKREKLRVGYSPTPTADFLPMALELYQAADPQNQVLLMDMDSDELIAGVERKTLDAALLVRPLGMTWPRLEFKALLELSVGVILPAHHRLARHATLSLDQAFCEPIVAFTRKGYGDYHSWLNAARKRSTKTPRVQLTADGSTSLIASVVSGQGIAFGPPAYEVQFGPRIKFVPLSTPVPALEVGVLRQRKRMNALLSAFVRATETAATRHSDSLAAMLTDGPSAAEEKRRPTHSKSA